MQARLRHIVTMALAAITLLAAATVAVAALEHTFGAANASSVYLVAVVGCALLVGTDGAILTAVAASVIYNYLFTEPRYTLEIHDPGVLLSVVLLLFVGIVVGQLAAMQRTRAEAASSRAREARVMFGVSRSLATRDSTEDALTQITAVLVEQAGLLRSWITIGADPVTEVVAADTGVGPLPPTPTRLRVLQRTPGDTPARWVRVQRPGTPARTPSPQDAYRVRIEASGELLGSIWALRDRDQGEPDRIETRLLATAADQVGQALAHDRVADQSRAADVARQSDSLKSALLQSVSHDFRTPLATIRAAAGSLRAGSPLSAGDRDASVDAIEREVAYLNRLVTNLLDLSRIESGALRADRDVFELDDLLGRAVERATTRLGSRTLETDLNASPVQVDPVFVDSAVSNVLDNALKHTPEATRIRVIARDAARDRVRLTIEDGGPGVPDDALPRLFEKFYRVPGRQERSRAGTGIGLAVARGLVEATGGRITARHSVLGGLAVDIELPALVLPPDAGTPGPAGADR